MKIKKKYQGVVIPAVTPVTESFKLDEGGVENMFSNFHSNGVYPFILGTTGESSSLCTELKNNYIKLAGKLKRPGDMLYAGIASNCFDESVELAKYCFDNGVDAVVANLPSYYRLSDGQVKKYFEQLVEQCNGPLIIYNIPATTHMSISLDVIDELSHHENIVATKDSERSDERLKESLKLWADRKDFSHFLGWAGRSAEAILNGSDGLVPSTGNLHPGIYNEMKLAALSGDADKVHALQKQSDILGNLYQSGRLLGESLWALKVLMNEAGLCQPYVVPPLQPSDDSEAIALIKGLHEIMELEGLKIN
jgi:dihydrodipicolinate synthase/N-acetylneuraminate lyase